MQIQKDFLYSPNTRALINRRRKMLKAVKPRLQCFLKVPALKYKFRFKLNYLNVNFP